MRIAIGPSSFAEKDSTPLQLLEQASVDIIPNPYGRRLSQQEIIPHLEHADGLIAGLEPLNRDVLESARKLKAIARVGIGMDNVDQTAAAELAIKVSNTPEGPTEAVAEMCLTSLLALKRRLPAFNTDLHQGVWQKRIGKGLKDSNVLMIGYGRIGRRFGEHLRYFRTHLLICDPVLKPSDLAEDETLVSMSEGLRLADVISLHASGSDLILGPAEFLKMKPGVIILNSARGSLIDETALMRSVKNNTVSGAWLDVFSDEPYHGPLTELSQVLLTPHISTYTLQCRRSMEETAVRNLLRDLNIQMD